MIVGQFEVNVGLADLWGQREGDNYFIPFLSPCVGWGGFIWKLIKMSAQNNWINLKVILFYSRTIYLVVCQHYLSQTMGDIAQVLAAVLWKPCNTSVKCFLICAFCQFTKCTKRIFTKCGLYVSLFSNTTALT